MDYLVIRPDGTLEEHIVDALTLEILQEELGQDAEKLPASDLALDAFVATTKVNYQGEALTMNARGTRLFQDVLWPGSTIVGSIVLAGPPDANGDSTSLDRDVADEVMHRLEHRT